MRRVLSVWVAVGSCLAMVLWIPGTAAADTSGSRTRDPVTVASGLNNPRQLTFDAKGNLYVAEAGSGNLNATDQSGGCAVGPEGPVCVGNTGSVTKISDPDHRARQSRIITGLLSVAGDGTGAAGIGVDAVSVAYNGDVYGIATYAPPPILATSVAAQNGQLLKIDRRGTVKPLFDVAAFSLAQPQPPGREAESDPYGLVRVGNNSYVADAAANLVYRIDNCNRIEIVARFEERVPGDESTFDGVPTSIAYSNGKFYVGQLSSLIPGAAKVTVFDSRWRKVASYGGLSSVTSVAVARNGDIYATELFTGEPFNSPGAVVRIAKHQTQATVISVQPTPGGVAVDSKGNVYVSVNSVAANVNGGPGGSVIRLAG